MRLEVTGSAPPDWDAFAGAHPDGSAYHLAPAVRIGSEAFGLESLFLTARGSGGELRGLLPLVQQSSRLFGRYLTSLPFFNYGGVLADGPDSLAALVAEAAVLGAQRGARHVELRHVAALTRDPPNRSARARFPACLRPATPGGFRALVPIVQRIEHRFPKLKIQVRFLLGILARTAMCS